MATQTVPTDTITPTSFDQQYALLVALVEADLGTAERKAAIAPAVRRRVQEAAADVIMAHLTFEDAFQAGLIEWDADGIITWL